MVVHGGGGAGGGGAGSCTGQGVVLVALAHILETHFVTCTVWW